MYEWNDILIVGDSFAAARSEPDHWPMALTLKLTGHTYDQNKLPRGTGHAGCSWWSTRCELLRELEIRVPKILIICHTDSGRLPSDYDYGLNLGSMLDRKCVVAPDNIVEAACRYYKYLHSSNFNAWAKKQWLLDLDTILQSANILIIHLHCFKEDIEFPLNRFGVTSAETLYEVGIAFYKNLGTHPSKLFDNHFKLPENLKIAAALYDTIINFKPEQNGTRQHLNLLQQ